MIKQRSVFFLQMGIVIIGLIALIILIRFPLTEGRAADSDLFHIYTDPFILYGYGTSIIFFVALYKTFLLLRYIRQGKLFSLNTIRCLKEIRYCAIVLGILVGLAGLYIKVFHDKNDDPAGFLGACMVIMFAAIIVARATIKFEKRLQDAVNA